MRSASTLAAGVVAALAPRAEIVGAYLFGSRARGEAHANSDVDLGLLGAQRLEVETLVELEHALERVLGMRVDVVDLATASPFLALEAVRGERVFERDPLALDQFDLYVLRRAGDLAFFERERRRELLSPLV